MIGSVAHFNNKKYRYQWFFIAISFH